MSNIRALLFLSTLCAKSGYRIYSNYEIKYPMEPAWVVNGDSHLVIFRPIIWLTLDN